LGSQNRLDSCEAAARLEAQDRSGHAEDSVIRCSFGWPESAANHLDQSAYVRGVEGHFLRTFQELGQIAGVTRVNRFRDTYITDQLRGWIDLVTIAKWAGHENLETLKLYADALRDLDEAARAAANRQERYALGPQLVKTA
jgi:integrase